MSLTLHLDLAPWREHLAATAAATPGIVPVAKGNGYGYGLPRLAREATRIGAEVLAVGTADEVAQVRAGTAEDPGWEGDIVVLTPWNALDPVATALLADPGVITTVGTLADLRTIAADHPGTRVVVEVLTSMLRFGLSVAELDKVEPLVDQVRFEGWTIHLPMAGDALAAAQELAQAALAAVKAPLWLSHLSAQEYATLTASVDVDTHLRLGTKLWLGAPQTRRVTAQVLAMHPVSRGQKAGYWQHPAPSDGWVVVVSGGTANGVALTAPSPGASLKQRAQTLVAGGMDALGKALSPYTLAGKKRFFVEPPHMQASLVFLPGAGTIAVGDEVPVEVRLTTAVVDRVIEH